MSSARHNRCICSISCNLRLHYCLLWCTWLINIAQCWEISYKCRWIHVLNINIWQNTGQTWSKSVQITQSQVVITELNKFRKKIKNTNPYFIVFKTEIISLQNMQQHMMQKGLDHFSDMRSTLSYQDQQLKQSHWQMLKWCWIQSE